MSTQEEQEIIKEWQEEIARLEKYDSVGGAWKLFYDAKDHPEVARELTTMFLNAVDKLGVKSCDYILGIYISDIKSLGRLDDKILDDVLKFTDKRKIKLYIDRDNCALDEFIVAMNEGKISPKLLMKNLSNGSLDAMALCVAKDPSLVEDFLKADKAVKEDKDQYYKYKYNPKALYQLSIQLDKLPEKMTPWLVDEIRKFDRDDLGECIPKTFFNIVRNNVKYMTEYQKDGYKLLNNKDAEFVAKIYEDLQNRVPDTLTEKNVKKNRPISSLTKEEQELSKACEDLLKGYKDRVALKAKLVKKYPMSAEALGVEDNNYINMCVNNLEHPEKENIRSILNRLEATEAKSYEDFAAAVDFVRRRDKFRKMCQEFNDEKTQANPRLTEYEKQQYKKDKISMQYVSEGQLSYGMAEAGIRSQEDASKVIKLFYEMNRRPETYGSEYNNFYPSTLKEMTNLEEWMYPIIKQAVRSEVVDPNRLGGFIDLFEAC